MLQEKIGAKGIDSEFCLHNRRRICISLISAAGLYRSNLDLLGGIGLELVRQCHLQRPLYNLGPEAPPYQQGLWFSG